MARRPVPPSSASSDNEDPPTNANAILNRLTLDSLPAEIHRTIVKLCYDADLRLDKALASFNKSSGGGRAGLPRDSLLNPTVFRKTHTRSIASLYAVSSKWRKLCKSHRFKILVAAKVLDPVFGVWIAQQYGHYFVKLDLRGVNRSHIMEVVKALPCLPNLKGFDLGGGPLAIFDHSAADIIAASILSKLMNAMKKAEILKLGKYETNEIRLMTSAAGNTLRHLSLRFDKPSTLFSLWSVLEPLNNLKELFLTFVRTSALKNLDLQELVNSYKADKTLALTELKINTHHFIFNVSPFVELFAPSLRTLILDVPQAPNEHEGEDDEEDADATTHLVPLTSLRELHSLELRGNCSLLVRELKRLERHDALRKVRFVTIHPARKSAPIDLMYIKARLTSASARVPEFTMYVNKSRLQLFASAFSRFEEYDVCKTTSPFLHPALALTDAETIRDLLKQGERPDQRQAVLDTLDDVLKFAVEWRERAVNTQDWADVARLAELLQPMDVERMVHKA
ncbi:hypothetical protein JCM10908_000500 [Rhodotorula pacifica]|uniref:uncharacterized protein n=1 Tax=Rhodotorula pacifica TaxID=1495444 RepID=UPI0031776BB7